MRGVDVGDVRAQLMLWEATKPARDYVYSLVARVVRSRELLNNPYVTGKLLALESSRGSHPYVVVHRRDSRQITTDDGLPVPPRDLREGFGSEEADYLASGRQVTSNMLQVLVGAGVLPESHRRVLDLGCAAGRMLRHYPRGPSTELWGVDIDANLIAWCQQWLSPPLLFAVGSTSPHLPFADGYFDFVYCGSVFTHMTELADAWFLEIKRILRDGGHAYVTIHDKHSVDLLMTDDRYRRPEFRWLTKFLESPDVLPVLATNYAYLAVGVEPMVQVFYDVDFLTRKWSQYGGTFLSVVEEAYVYQTALLWQKS